MKKSRQIPEIVTSNCWEILTTLYTSLPSTVIGRRMSRLRHQPCISSSTSQFVTVCSCTNPYNNIPLNNSRHIKNNIARLAWTISWTWVKKLLTWQKSVLYRCFVGFYVEAVVFPTEVKRFETSWLSCRQWLQHLVYLYFIYRKRINQRGKVTN